MTDDNLFHTYSWAIAPLGTVTVGGAGVLGATLFALLNRATWRQHYLLAVGRGIAFDAARTVKAATKLDDLVGAIEVMKKVEGHAARIKKLREILAIFDVVESGATFKAFHPDRAMRFSDFDHKSFRLTHGESRWTNDAATYLTLWSGWRWISDVLLQKRLLRTSSGIIPFAGHTLLGETRLIYGDGEVFGVAEEQVMRDPLIEEEPRELDPIRDTSVRVSAYQDPVLSVPGDILFEHDDDTVRPEAFADLGAVARKLQQRARRPVVIRGHTDSSGSRDYNLGLSLRRARAVKRWFVMHGVHEAPAFAVVPCGETQPAVRDRAPDGSLIPEAQAQNRRVEIQMYGSYPTP